MGSVLDYIECPHCKGEASTDFYYKTGEEYITCTNCGYYYHYQMIDRSKSVWDENNWSTEVCATPYGSCGIRTYGSHGTQYGTLKNEQEYISFKLSMFDNQDILQAWVRRFINGEIVQEMLIDNTSQVDHPLKQDGYNPDSD